MNRSEVILDSDVIISWLRGHNTYAQAISKLLGEGHILVWTPVSIAEIFAGVRKSEEELVEGLLLVLESVQITQEIGKKAGEYLKDFAKSHHVEVADALIAATCHIHGFPLWTLNRKHYPMKDIRFFSPPTASH